MKNTAFPWHFFAIAFLLSWICWIPAALTGQESLRFPTVILYLLGGFGPSLAGLWCIYRSPNRSARADLWARLLDFRRISPGWLAICLFAAPAVVIDALALNAFFGMRTPDMPTLASLAGQPVAIIPTIVFTLLAGPLSEELGWRGFALDHLLARFGRWGASILLGLVWWVWHLPLFWINGTTHSAWGIATLDFWLFPITVVSLSILMTWAYTANRRSLLSSIIIHFSFNLALTLFAPLTPAVRAFYSLFLLAMALGSTLAAQVFPARQPSVAGGALPSLETP